MSCCLNDLEYKQFRYNFVRKYRPLTKQWLEELSNFKEGEVFRYFYFECEYECCSQKKNIVPMNLFIRIAAYLLCYKNLNKNDYYDTCIDASWNPFKKLQRIKPEDYLDCVMEIMSAYPKLKPYSSDYLLDRPKCENCLEYWPALKYMTFCVDSELEYHRCNKHTIKEYVTFLTVKHEQFLKCKKQGEQNKEKK